MNIEDRFIIYLNDYGFENIVFDQPISEDRMDSFFYDGCVGSFTKGDFEFMIDAVGEVNIYDQKEEEMVVEKNEVFDCFEYFKTDADLEKYVGTGEIDKRFMWENNNWFEVVVYYKGEFLWNPGVIYHELDHAVFDQGELYDEIEEQLKEYAAKYFPEGKDLREKNIRENIAEIALNHYEHYYGDAIGDSISSFEAYNEIISLAIRFEEEVWSKPHNDDYITEISNFVERELGVKGGKYA